jgi:trehalose 6-phosphate synthase/phosphatase
MPSAPREARRLIVVSNRLPLTLKRTADGFRAERSAGGLATAVEPFLKKLGGLWVGWPGDDPGDPRREPLLAGWRERLGLVAVDLPPEISAPFYLGYANQTLWPVFHHFAESLQFDGRGWDAYVRANEIFRDAVLRELQDGDLVWIHDYHLMLLPGLLREARRDAKIGFFLHIPFPSSDLFRALPRREELLRGLLGANLLAFQTHNDLQHLREALLRVLGIDSRMDRVEVGGETTSLEALPIGIDPRDFVSLLEKDREAIRALANHKRRFQGQKVLLAVDRLDYTKGIPHRLRTFRRLLTHAPHLRGTLVLVQVAVPSRERIPRYAELRREVSELVGELNGEFGTPEWTPVVFLRRGLSRAELTALYAVSDVGWITPLRDGMNLVAKEYVACQRGGPGALVLSEFAGAAAEMGEAFLVNPYDEDRTAATLETVLSLPAQDRAVRMTALRKRVERNDVHAWGERFLGALEKETERLSVVREQSQPLSLPEITEAFEQAGSRMLLFDYDGTLVPFRKTPWEASPESEVGSLLGRLARDRGSRVAVISGRPRKDLEVWFGGIPRLWLGAEHGVLLRSPETRLWSALRPPVPSELWERVRPVLEHFADRTPGSLIEDKEYSLVFHYRMADPGFAEWLANELVATLEGMLADTELRAMRGHKSVEIRPTWAHKGSVVDRFWSAGRPGFALAVGDDRTDEDLFDRLGKDAWTVHVGPGSSRARFRLPDAESVLTCLHWLAEVVDREGGRSGAETMLVGDPTHPTV